MLTSIWEDRIAEDRGLRALRLRRQVGAIREGAGYWRRLGRVATADELERVATFVETLVEIVPFAAPSAIRRAGSLSPGR